MGELVAEAALRNRAAKRVSGELGDRVVRAAAGRDRHLRLEQGIQRRRAAGDHHGRAGDQDRNRDSRLHLLLLYVNRALGRLQGRFKELWS
jgi:hypothetical protein